MELAARNLEEDDLGREHLALVPSPSGSIEDTYQFLQRFFEDIDEDSMDGELVIPASPRSDVELVRVKTCLPVALKQNDAFLLWRAVTLTKYYKSRCMGDMHEATAEGALHYLATAGNDSGYRHEGVPGHLYFLRNILPVVSNMARTPEALEKLSIDALGVLKELITSQLSFTTHRTSPALLDSFFEDIEPEDMRSWGRGGGAAAGQFKYFLIMENNHGKMIRKIKDNED